MRTSYREAMRAALRDALARDDRVFLMGEDVGRYGGCFAVSMGLLEEVGPALIALMRPSAGAGTQAEPGSAERGEARKHA